MADKDDLQKDLDDLFGKLEGGGEKEDDLVELPPAKEAQAEQASAKPPAPPAPPAPPKPPAPPPARRGLPQGMSSEEADALIAKILGGPPEEAAAETAVAAAAESSGGNLGDILAGLDAEPVEVGAATPGAVEAPREEPAEVASQAAAAEEPEAALEVEAEEAPALAAEPVEVAPSEPEPVAAFSAAEPERPSREPDDAVSAFFNRLKRESDLASEAPTPVATPAAREEAVEAAEPEPVGAAPSREAAVAAAFLSAEEVEAPAESPTRQSRYGDGAAPARAAPLDEISRPWRAVALAAWAFMIWMLSRSPAASFPGIGIPHADVAAHLMVFGVLAALLARFACGERPKSPIWAIAALSILVASAYGIVDEFHQLGVAGRDFSYGDMLADAVGAALGAVAWAKVPEPEGAGGRAAFG